MHDTRGTVRPEGSPSIHFNTKSHYHLAYLYFFSFSFNLVILTNNTETETETGCETPMEYAAPQSAAPLRVDTVIVIHFGTSDECAFGAGGGVFPP